MRTMAPYSEYLQGYVYEKNDLKSGGKLQDDFRITYWGRVFRKLWIDEIPMIYNLIKGEMKLVGVRPLSKHYFSLYPKDMQQLRTKYKPGLLPPYYVDLPKTLEDIVESERKYLTCYQKSPIWTDVKYFVLIFNNIIIKGARSS